MLDFLNHVLPKQGYPLAFFIKADGKPFNSAYHNTAVMAGSLLSADNIHKSVYFGLATALVPKQWDVRKEDNLSHVKCVWADIDIKEGHYATKQEVFTALAELCRSISWPVPTLVMSGGGIHAYWTTDRDITIAEWRTLSVRLIAVAKHTGFKLDPAATRIPTQVLRPPGTTNRKEGRPETKVTLLKYGRHSRYELLLNNINAYVTNNNVDLKPATTSSTSYNASILPAGWFIKPTLREAKPVILGCRQMQEGAMASEATWRGVLSTCLLLKNGEQVAHLLSSKDHRYVASDTDAKIQIIKNQNTTPVPYRCDTFDDLNPGVCDNCVNRGRIKSPIVLGFDNTEHEETEVAYETPALPPVVPRDIADVQHPPAVTPPPQTLAVLSKVGAYQQDANGLSLVIPGDEDMPPQVKKICAQRVYPIDYLYKHNDDGNKEYYYLWRIENTPDDYNDVLLPGDVFHGDHVINHFTKYGVIIEKRSEYATFGNLMRTFMSKVQTEKKARPMHRNLGWQDNGDFVCGKNTVHADGSVSMSTLDGEASDQVGSFDMQPKGDFKIWQDGIAVFNTKGQEHAQLGICAAFAAPLMKFTAIPTLVLALQGVSGAGKSAIHKANASVWGSSLQIATAPNTAAGDTLLSVIRMIGVSNNLPINMEEITNMQIDKISDFVHALALGREKSRLKGAANNTYSRNAGLTWATMVVTSANETIRDKLTMAKSDSVAESMRIFELTNIQLVGTDWASDTIRIKRLDDNYGHAGLHYAKYLQANKDKLEQWVAGKAKWLSDKMSATQDERFWVQGMAAMMVGMELASAAGLIPFDIDNLVDYICLQYLRQRGQVSQAKEFANTAFAEMINNGLREAVVVKENDVIDGLHVVAKPFGALHMRINLSDGKGFISSTAVRDYAKKNNIPFTTLIQNGVQGKYLEGEATTRTTLGKGVPGLAGGGQVRCYEFTLSPNDLVDVETHVEINRSVKDEN